MSATTTASGPPQVTPELIERGTRRSVELAKETAALTQRLHRQHHANVRRPAMLAALFAAALPVLLFGPPMRHEHLAAALAVANVLGFAAQAVRRARRNRAHLTGCAASADRIVAAGIQHGQLVQDALTIAAEEGRLQPPSGRTWDGEEYLAVARMTSPQTLFDITSARRSSSWIAELRSCLDSLAGRKGEWSADDLNALAREALHRTQKPEQLRLLVAVLRDELRSA